MVHFLCYTNGHWNLITVTQNNMYIADSFNNKPGELTKKLINFVDNLVEEAKNDTSHDAQIRQKKPTY